MVKDIRVFENLLGISQKSGYKSLADEFNQEESIRCFSTMIMEDPDWLEMVRKKQSFRGRQSGK